MDTGARVMRKDNRFVNSSGAVSDLPIMEFVQFAACNSLQAECVLYMYTGSRHVFYIPNMDPCLYTYSGGPSKVDHKT